MSQGQVGCRQIIGNFFALARFRKNFLELFLPGRGFDHQRRISAKGQTSKIGVSVFDHPLSEILGLALEQNRFV